MPRTILIVDDDADNRETLAMAVESTSDDQVVTACGAAEALALLDGLAAQGRPLPHLALVDVVMGGASGVELRRTLATRFPSLPVAFVTALPAHGLPAGLGGAAPILYKPYSLDELVALVAAHARQD